MKVLNPEKKTSIRELLLKLKNVTVKDYECVACACVCVCRRVFYLRVRDFIELIDPRNLQASCLVN